MNLTSANNATLLLRSRKWLKFWLTEGALIAVIAMALVALFSLHITQREVNALSTPTQHNDFWQVANIALELQQLEFAARQAASDNAAPQAIEQLAVRLDVLLSILSPDANTPRTSTAILARLPDAQEELAQ